MTFVKYYKEPIGVEKLRSERKIKADKLLALERLKFSAEEKIAIKLILTLRQEIMDLDSGITKLMKKKKR